MGTLEGKIARVTGGNSGIGLATAKEFVGEGAYVFITGLRDAELAAVKEIGNNVTAVRADLSTLGALDRPFAQVKREKGTLDVIFAKAGSAQLDPSLAMVTASLASWAVSMPEHRMVAWIVDASHSHPSSATNPDRSVYGACRFFGSDRSLISHCLSIRICG